MTIAQMVASGACITGFIVALGFLIKTQDFALFIALLIMMLIVVGCVYFTYDWYYRNEVVGYHYGDSQSKSENGEISKTEYGEDEKLEIRLAVDSEQTDDNTFFLVIAPVSTASITQNIICPSIHLMDLNASLRVEK